MKNKGKPVKARVKISFDLDGVSHIKTIPFTVTIQGKKYTGTVTESTADVGGIPIENSVEVNWDEAPPQNMWLDEVVLSKYREEADSYSAGLSIEY